MTPHDLVLAAGHLLALAQLSIDSEPDPQAVKRERAVLAAVLRGFGDGPDPALLTSEARALALLCVQRARHVLGDRATAHHARRVLAHAPRLDMPLAAWHALVLAAADELDLAASATPRRSAIPAFERASRARQAIEAARPALAALLSNKPTAATARALRDAADLLSPALDTNADEAA